MRALSFGLAVVALCAPMLARATTISDFLARDAEIAAKGVTDPASPEFDSQNALIGAAIAKFRSANAVTMAEGKPPQACLPPPGEGRMSGGDIIAWFRAMARSDAMMSIEDAVAALLRARYPCKG